MPIVDDFDHKSDTGFVRAYDARDARRQFQVSIVLVVVLSLAAVALGMLMPLVRQIATGGSSAAKANSPQIAETLLDIRADLTRLSHTLPFGPRGA